jgi:hypothetical protein
VRRSERSEGMIHDRANLIGAGAILVTLAIVGVACSPTGDDDTAASRADCGRRVLATENYPEITLLSCVSTDLFGAIGHVADVNYERGLKDGYADGRPDGYDSGWVSALETYVYCSEGNEIDSRYSCGVIPCTFGALADFGPFAGSTAAPDQPTPQECRVLYSKD